MYTRRRVKERFVQNVGEFCRVRAYGPGIEPSGPIIGAPANFTVETFSAGKGNVEVTVDDPKGLKLPVGIFVISLTLFINFHSYLVQNVTFG